MHVEERTEIGGRFVEQLQADRAVFVSLVVLRRPPGIGVVDVVGAVLVEPREARRPFVAERDALGGLDVEGAVGRERDAAVAVGVADAGCHRIELDHTRRRVAPEQTALRAVEHLDPCQVENWKTLEQRVLLHHIVVDQRDRLRGGHAKIGVAVAADVEARKRPAERRFDVQARHPARQQAQVTAARGEHVERFTREGRHRHRHVLDVLDLAIGGDRDRLQRARRGTRRRTWCRRFRHRRRDRLRIRASQAEDDQCRCDQAGRPTKWRAMPVASASGHVVSDEVW